MRDSQGRNRRGGIRAALLVALALLLMGLVPSAAIADDRYASPGGTAASPCDDSLDPCPIDVAINEASSGDDITLLGGPFTSSVALGVVQPCGCAIKTGLTVHGAPGSRPVVNSTAAGGASFYVGLGSVLRDVDLTSAVASNTLLTVVGGTVERVSVHESGDDARACGLTNGATVRDIVCWNSSVSGSSASAMQVGSAFAGDFATLRHVTAVTSIGPGIRVLAANGGSIAMTATNVIAKGAGGTGGEDVLTQMASGGTAATATLDHSNYATESEASPGDITDPGALTNQTTPPVFVNAATGDFHQQASSAGTVNLGTAAGLLIGELDLEGQARNQGPAPDIGADELPAPPAPVLTGTDPGSPANNNNPKVFGTAETGSTVTLYDNGTCAPPSVITGPESTFAPPGFAVTVPDNSTTTFSATATTALGPSACSTVNVTYTEVTPSPPPAGGGGSTPTGFTPQATTGQRAAALKKCKKKRSARARRNCKKRANKLPV